jgi:hypothetical protein
MTIVSKRCAQKGMPRVKIVKIGSKKTVRENNFLNKAPVSFFLNIVFFEVIVYRELSVLKNFSLSCLANVGAVLFISNCNKSQR